MQNTPSTKSLDLPDRERPRDPIIVSLSTRCLSLSRPLRSFPKSCQKVHQCSSSRKQTTLLNYCCHKTPASHFVYLLKEGTSLPKDAIQIISREMTGSKPALRRLCACWVGTSFGAAVIHASLTVEAFVDGLLPSLESNLKTVASNPLGNSAGPLEGFIAIACLLGPISQH